MIEFVITIERESGQSEQRVSVPEEMAEFSALRYVQTLQEIEGAPEWLVKFFGLSPDRQQTAFSKLGEAKQTEYLVFLLRIIGASSGVDIQDLTELPMAEHSASVVPLAYRVLNAIGSYKPEEMDSFDHKGHRYIFPTSTVANIGEFKQVTFGPKMKAGEVIEAMRRREVFGVRNEEGKPQVKDGLFFSDLGMIAALSRRVDKSGNQEKPPLGLNEFSDFVNNRMEELADLPGHIFRNAGFFLTNLYVQSVRTLISNMSLKVRKEKQKRQKKAKD